MPRERTPAAAPCCPHYHRGVELIGRRWNGAILAVLLDAGPLRFRRLADAVPDVSDRLLSARLRELEAGGLVEPVTLGGHKHYAVTAMGSDLRPILDHLAMWARRWLV